MEKVNTCGKMEDHIKDSISMIKSMDMGFTHGWMAGDTRDIGKMEKDKEEASMFCLMESVVKAFGTKIKG